MNWIKRLWTIGDPLFWQVVGAVLFVLLFAEFVKLTH